MTKIYFCGSIRGGRQLSDVYKRIIQKLSSFGRVLTEHLGDDAEIEAKDRILTDRQIHDRDMDWIRESDLVVAEVTIPSLGVGYEIGRAIELGKPVACLFKYDAGYILSAMISGSEGIELNEYSQPGKLDKFLERFISEHAPRRIS
jgi:nucleoside 2-deoxyribosyltransferase